MELPAYLTIGRIGCFQTGLSDRTYGKPASLPWGVDFGDRIFRHPTQLYEVVVMVGLLIFLKDRERKVEYYKLCQDFIKPGDMPHHFNIPIERGCPYDCGLCPDHEQHSCVTLVEITDRCNLDCPICYADSGAAEVPNLTDKTAIIAV